MNRSVLYGCCVWCAAIVLLITAFFAIVGCSTPALYSPNIDAAFVQAVAMQWELQPVREQKAQYVDPSPVVPAASGGSIPERDNHLPDITKMVTPNSSAAAEGESTPAVSKGSPPPAVETSPKIVVYSTFGCRACVYLCKQLTEAGYDFDQVYLGGIEHRQTKFPYARIDGKRKTYEQVLAWLKERKESNEI